MTVKAASSGDILEQLRETAEQQMEGVAGEDQTDHSLIWSQLDSL